MEVRPNYRQTDIGIIPMEWKITNLGELGGFSKGKGISKSQVTTDGLPCVRYGEIYTVHDNVITEFYSFIHRGVARNSQRLKKNDILFAGSGETRDEIGKCAAFVHDIEAYAGGDIVILSPVFGDSRFLGYLLNSPCIITQKASAGQGDAVVHISARHLSSIQIPLPPTIEEQEAIATALSDTDILIKNLEKVIEKKRSIKKGAMQELLTGKKRLLGFGEEWEEKKIGEIAEIYRGASPRPINSPIWFSENSDVGWVRITDVTRTNKVLLQTTQKLSELGIRNSRFVDIGNLIMSICATVGRPIITGIKVCIHDGFVVFENLQIEKDFFYYYLSFIEGTWGKHGQIGSQMNLNTGLIKSIIFNCPMEKNEQQAIAQILNNMDAEIDSLEMKLNKYRDIKKGMMQELLIGKKRLV
jgi:type I restriction enzyme S subunit